MSTPPINPIAGSAGTGSDLGKFNSQLAALFQSLSTCFAGDAEHAVHPSDLETLKLVVMHSLDEAMGVSRKLGKFQAGVGGVPLGVTPTPITLANPNSTLTPTRTGLTRTEQSNQGLLRSQNSVQTVSEALDFEIVFSQQGKLWIVAAHWNLS